MTNIQFEQQHFFERVGLEAKASPILQLLFDYFKSRQDTIYRMKDQVLSDDQLQEFISNAFGIMGGGSLNNTGWYEYSGGKRPRLELQDRKFNTLQELEGDKLVSAFRNLFRVVSEQLTLF